MIAGLDLNEVESDEVARALRRYDGANEVLFVHASEKIAIE